MMLGASMNKILVLLTLVLRPAASKTCNGLQETCSLKFDQVTFAGTHNSGSGFNGVLKYYSGFPASSCWYRNQGKSFTQQLEAGIRFFDIDLCMRGAKVWTGHSTAFAGSIYEVFRQIGEFLKTNKNEVVVIRISDIRGVPSDKLIQEMKSRFSGRDGNTGLSDYKSRTHRFPTINQAIAEDKRVFVFMKNDFCDSSCRSNNRFVLSQDTYVVDTYMPRTMSSSCNGVKEQTRQKCVDAGDKQFVIVSIFGSSGLCIGKMAQLCNLHVRESVEKCATERRKRGRYVNFIIVDWITKAPKGQSVVDVANEQTLATAVP